MNAPHALATPEVKTLDTVFFELPYVPEFLLEETRLWFAPQQANPKFVHVELVGDSGKNWQAYYSKKGWCFVHEEPRPAEGPFQVPASGIHLTVLEPGKIFTPKPVLRLVEGGPTIPIVSLQKRRPLNEWRPNYLQALNFIKKYEWAQSVPYSVKAAIWEIEECGQIAGSVAWRNAEIVLRNFDSRELRLTLSDIFFNRPEDYPLGSEIYLRVLGTSGPNGFDELVNLSRHPVSRKRKIVASTLGELKNCEGLPALLKLLEDEDPEVRRSALRALGKVGVRTQQDPDGAVAAYLESPEIPERVWAAQAFVKGGDRSHEKYLLTLVKEEPRLLTDMGELGDVLADLKLEESVPYLMNRLKSDRQEFRADAAEALGKVTGLNREYQSNDDDEQRRSALKIYQRWWDDRKKERRTAGAR